MPTSKKFVLLWCHGSAGDADFHAWWQCRGAHLAALPGVRKYVQNRVTQELRRDHRPPGMRAVAGFEEIWLDDSAPAAVHADISSMDGAGPASAAPVAAIKTLAVREHVVFTRDLQAPKLQKRFSLLKRREDLSCAAFGKYWQHVHAPLAFCHRFVARYVQNHVLPDEWASNSREAGEANIDGIGEFLISDTVRIEEDYRSPAGETMKADVANFVQTVSTYLVEPCEWPAPDGTGTDG